MIYSKFTKLVLLIVIIPLVSSCVYNKTEDFYVHKFPIIDSDSTIRLKLDGVYIGKTYSEKSSSNLVSKGSVFYLFGDGSAKWAGWRNYCCPGIVSQASIDKIENHYLFTSRSSHWGHYMIKGDSIIIQDFSHCNDSWANHFIIEYKGKLLNDSTFELYSQFSYLDNNFFQQDEPIIYNFYSTNSKPDSSNTWFNNRNWFKREVHKSRKNNSKN